METRFFPSLRHLRAFAAVAQWESISRASEELHLSQPAVTQAVARLEADLDVSLFVRRQKGTYLTDYGKIYEKRIGRFLSSLEGGLSECCPPHANATSGARNVAARRITKAQIRALLAINESASFMQAARCIGVSQASLHRSARTLEDHLHCELFHHTANGVTTNEKGTRLAHQLLLATRELEWAEEEIEAEKGLVRGRILVGALMLGGSYLLASTVNRFTADYPDAYVQISNGNYDVLLHGLRTGMFDFVVGLLRSPPPAEDAVEEALMTDPYVVVVRRGHPLTQQASVTVEDLTRYDWVLPSPTAARREAYQRLFSSGKFPRANIETHSLPTSLVLLAEGDRIAILTKYELLFQQKMGLNLTGLDVGPIEPQAAIGLTTRKNWLPTQLQRVFLGYLRGQAALAP